MASSPLHRLSALGQSVWVDYLSRNLLESGELEQMTHDDAVVGVTSNPTIFQKALAEGDSYDGQLREVLTRHTGPQGDLRRPRLARCRRRVRSAAPDLGGHQGADGYVSMEVDPTFAYNIEATLDEAMRLHTEINKPNLLVKIPATKPGLAASKR